MRHRAVYVYIVRATCEQRMDGCRSRRAEDAMKDTIVPLSVFTSKNERLRAVASPAHSRCAHKPPPDEGNRLRG